MIRLSITTDALLMGLSLQASILIDDFSVGGTFSPGTGNPGWGRVSDPSVIGGIRETLVRDGHSRGVHYLEVFNSSLELWNTSPGMATGGLVFYGSAVGITDFAWGADSVYLGQGQELNLSLNEYNLFSFDVRNVHPSGEGVQISLFTGRGVYATQINGLSFVTYDVELSSFFSGPPLWVFLPLKILTVFN